MRNRGSSEHKTDTIEWNKQMNRTLREYEKAVNKQETSIEVLTLMEEKLNFNYETDYIILDNRAYFVAELEDYLNKRKKETYIKPQEIWNMELQGALESGDILQTIRLMQIGKSRAYVKSVDTISQYAEYLGRINSVYCRIQKNIESER